jgi:pentatricopeptide repeat domain (PPR motif)
MGRKDGNKAFFKVRPPTRKQRKRYNMRLKEQEEKAAKHSKPGSKAGPRREFLRDEQEFLVDRALGKNTDKLPPEFLDYDFGNVLVDDLIGNSAHLTSSPNPKPLYLGWQYEKHYAKVSEMMKEYRDHLQLSGKKDGNDESSSLAPPLPTDKQISLLLRSYRDRHSSKSKPLGIVKALRFLITDMRLPTFVFGVKTYATLMLCAATPKEARRVMKMMVDNGHPFDEYIYSILIDIYAKRGDFRGADEVLSEMRFEGIAPTLPAYTSLLASCFKVINTAAMPQQIKAEAGNLAWDRWKELRINGLDPDVMAYGAIIRIMGARGFPEKALNLIEEMQVNEVKPTTLIFSSALKAVSRSHANALRFEGGRSKKNKRRELITAHHGKLAKRIVVLAEQADVEQDDGFTSALMLCAATAGDAATAKAIYLASEVRKLEHLRTIGGPEHLSMIRGEDPVMKDDESTLIDTGNSRNLKIPESSSNAAEEGSLMLQNEFEANSPKLMLNPKKKKIDTRKLNALLCANANALERRGLGDIWRGKENKGYLDESSLRYIKMRYTPQYVDKSIPGLTSIEAGLGGVQWDDQHLDKQGKKLRLRKFMGPIGDQEDNRIDELDPTLYRLLVDDEDILFDTERKENSENIGSFEETYEFKSDEGEAKLYTNESMPEQDAFMKDIGANELQTILNSETEMTKMLQKLNIEGNIDDMLSSDHLKRKIENDEDEDMNDIFGDNMNDQDDLSEAEERLFEKVMAGQKLSDQEKSTFQAMFSGNKSNIDIGETDEANTFSTHSELIELETVDDGALALPEDSDDLDIILNGLPKARINKVRNEFKTTLGTPSLIRLVPLLRENMPEIIDRDWLIEKNLTDAETVMNTAKDDGIVDSNLMNSMLQVYAKAGKINDAIAFYNEEYKLMEQVSHNVQIATTSNNKYFSHNNTVVQSPNSVSDRAIIQMLIEKKDISRALDFKENSVEVNGRKLDLLSYGSLIEHYGNKGQVGSAILVLKECIKVHGSPPGEKSLSRLRLACRQKEITKEVGLEKLIGKDPLEWLREGEGQMKREYSKKGRRDLLLVKNKLLHI